MRNKNRSVVEHRIGAAWPAPCTCASMLGLQRGPAHSALLRAAVLAAGAALSTSCSVGDQVCTPDSQYLDKSDQCPYGAPGGPKLSSDNGCPLIVMNPAGPGCTATWEGDIFPLFQRDPATGAKSGGACTRQACHAPGSLGGLRVVIPDDATQAFNNLRDYAPAGRPYVSDKDGEKETSFILCNLQGLPGGGKQMPVPSTYLTSADIDLVKTWAGCGMPHGPGGGTGGGGGAGGAGAGGAGGAL